MWFGWTSRSEEALDRDVGRLRQRRGGRCREGRRRRPLPRLLLLAGDRPAGLALRPVGVRRAGGGRLRGPGARHALRQLANALRTAASVDGRVRAADRSRLPPAVRAAERAARLARLRLRGARVGCPRRRHPVLLAALRDARRVGGVLLDRARADRPPRPALGLRDPAHRARRGALDRLPRTHADRQLPHAPRLHRRHPAPGRRLRDRVPKDR